MNKDLRTLCKTDPADSVTEPILHDANLVAVDLMKNKEVTISFRLVSGKLVNLYLEGVESFICDNLRLGNIVLDFSISSGNGANLENLKEYFDSPKVENIKFNRYIENIQQKIMRNDLLIVELTPSYGCTLKALVSSVKYENIG